MLAQELRSTWVSHPRYQGKESTDARGGVPHVKMPHCPLSCCHQPHLQHQRSQGGRQRRKHPHRPSSPWPDAECYVRQEQCADSQLQELEAASSPWSAGAAGARWPSFATCKARDGERSRRDRAEGNTVKKKIAAASAFFEHVRTDLTSCAISISSRADQGERQRPPKSESCRVRKISGRSMILHGTICHIAIQKHHVCACPTSA